MDIFGTDLPKIKSRSFAFLEAVIDRFNIAYGPRVAHCSSAHLIHDVRESHFIVQIHDDT